MIRFINPNYHVILIHYPLALLGVGLLIEIFSFLWPAGTLRVAGQWMLLLGALATIPAATSGLFAKYDVLNQLSGGQEFTWHDIKENANLTALQWQLLNRHVLLSSIGACVASLGAIFWLGSGADWPRPPGIFLLAMFAAAMGLMAFGAYGAGEMVYRTQLATRSQDASDKLLADWRADADSAPSAERFRKKLDFYVDPLQAHIIGAGVVFALAAAAWGLSFQKSAQLHRKPLPRLTAPGEAPPPPAQSEMDLAPAARFWLFTALFSLIAVGVGWYVFAADLPTPLWNIAAIFKTDILLPYQKDPHNSARVLAHLILGGSIVVLALLLIPAARYSARSRLLIGFLGLLMLAAIAAQIGIGMLMLYDSDSGPLTHFNAPPPAPTTAVAQN